MTVRNTSLAAELLLPFQKERLRFLEGERSPADAGADQTELLMNAEENLSLVTRLCELPERRPVRKRKPSEHANIKRHLPALFLSTLFRSDLQNQAHELMMAQNHTVRSLDAERAAAEDERLLARRTSSSVW